MTKQITGILLEMTAEFAGEYPDVPLAEGIELDTLVEGDENPFFITVPVGEADAWSRNERRYPRSEVDKVRRAVVEQRITGQLGHIRTENRGSEFTIPVIHWIGATWDNDKLWAKGYIPKTQQELREYFRVKMRTNGRTGTSIYGTGEMDEDANVTLHEVEGIDIAHEYRVGIPATAAVPRITAETTNKSEDEKPVEKEIPMPEEIQETPPTGFYTEAQMIEAREELREQIRDRDTEIARLRSQVRALKTMREMLDIEDGEDPIGALRETQAVVEQLRAENRELLDGYIASQVAEHVKLESVRGIVVESVEGFNPDSRGAVDNALAKVLARESVKTLLKMQVAETAGPPQSRPQSKPDADALGETMIFIPEVL